jgi:kynureninase
MQKITEAGHRAGAMVGFDLAHAAGHIELQLHAWGADFACWCSYKYLNSGPGAIGGVFIHERHHKDNTLNRFAGWWGYDAGTRFKMEKGFVPDAGANGWQLSTPSLLLYATHKASLELFEEAGMQNLHAKRKKLNAFLWFVLDEVEKRQGEKIFEVITPRHETEHGCQISLLVNKNGRKIYDALMQQGFMVDWREPNVIRLAPVPFYNTFAEVFTFASALSEIVSSLK